MVHRPELEPHGSRPRTTTSSCSTTCCGSSGLQSEHDRFVELMRSRGIEVFLFRDLSGGTRRERRCAPTSDRGRGSEYTVGLSLVEDVRLLRLRHCSRTTSRQPDRRPDGRRVGDRRLANSSGSSLPRRRSTTRARSSYRHCRTPCSHGTHRAGSTAASPSTRCTGRPGDSRRLQRRRDLPRHPMFADAEFEFWYPPTRRRRTVRDPRTSGARRWKAATSADRQRHGTHRAVRAHPGEDDRAGRPRAVRQGGGRPGHRARDDEGPRTCTSTPSSRCSTATRSPLTPSDRRGPGDQPPPGRAAWRST